MQSIGFTVVGGWCGVLGGGGGGKRDNKLAQCVTPVPGYGSGTTRTGRPWIGWLQITGDQLCIVLRKRDAPHRRIAAVRQRTGRTVRTAAAAAAAAEPLSTRARPIVSRAQSTAPAASGQR